MTLRAVALALITLTLALKLNGNYIVPQEDLAGAFRAASLRLEAQGFSVQLSYQGRGRIDASRGDCTVKARILDPHGTSNSAYREQLGPAGRLTYARSGQWSETLPRLAPLFEYYLVRELARQGIATSRSPVWIVALGPGCRQLPDAAMFDVPARLIPTR